MKMKTFAAINRLCAISSRVRSFLFDVSPDTPAEWITVLDLILRKLVDFALKPHLKTGFSIAKLESFKCEQNASSGNN